MDSIDDGWLKKLGLKGVYFGANYWLNWLNKITKTPYLKTFSRTAGVASLVLSSVDILFAINDIRKLGQGHGLHESHLEQLEELAYLRLLYAKYLFIELAQNQILNCN